MCLEECEEGESSGSDRESETPSTAGYQILTIEQTRLYGRSNRCEIFTVGNVKDGAKSRPSEDGQPSRRQLLPRICNAGSWSDDHEGR
jgi:hypothetical protein